jgi:hypothetical protein
MRGFDGNQGFGNYSGRAPWLGFRKTG